MPTCKGYRICDRGIDNIVLRYWSIRSSVVSRGDVESHKGEGLYHYVSQLGESVYQGFAKISHNIHVFHSSSIFIQQKNENSFFKGIRK